jgi:hypothetical protein
MSIPSIPPVDVNMGTRAVPVADMIDVVEAGITVCIDIDSMVLVFEAIGPGVVGMIKEATRTVL